MNAYHDLRRRVGFIVHELHLQNRDASGYHLVVSRDLFSAALRDMPEILRAQYKANGVTLLGFPLTLTDRETDYLVMNHEVRG